MQDLKKQDLFKKIWNRVDGLKEGIDAWEFKDYVFGFLFYRYISEDFLNYVNNHPKIPDGFKYEFEDDNSELVNNMKESFIQEKGFFIYPQDLFSNIKKKSDDRLHGIGDLNEDLSDAFSRIEKFTKDSNHKRDFEGLFQLIDLTDNKLGKEIIQKNRRIKKIMDGIHDLNFELENQTLWGDVYEYLMEKYVSGAGKIGGEFYTPSEISILLFKLICSHKKIDEIKSVYDPACGTGSMLLKFGNLKNISFFGQEINPTTYSLCKINMFLSGVPCDKFDIELGNTLTNDKFMNQSFDVIVSSPPFGGKWIGKSEKSLESDPRFQGPGKLAPSNKSDYAFIMHSLYHLKDNGVAAIVCFPGILFREQNELDIRKWLIQKNYIDSVIQLTDNLLFGKSNSICILVFKKNKTNEGIFFINAKDCFDKYQGRSKLTEQNISRIHQAYLNKGGEEGFARLVDREEIEQNGYSLSVGTYVTQKNQEEEIDIEEVNRNSRELSEKIYEINKEIDKIIKDL